MPGCVALFFVGVVRPVLQLGNATVARAFCAPKPQIRDKDRKQVPEKTTPGVRQMWSLALLCACYAARLAPVTARSSSPAHSIDPGRPAEKGGGYYKQAMGQLKAVGLVFWSLPLWFSISSLTFTAELLSPFNDSPQRR